MRCGRARPAPRLPAPSAAAPARAVRGAMPPRPRTAPHGGASGPGMRRGRAPTTRWRPPAAPTPLLPSADGSSQDRQRDCEQRSLESVNIEYLRSRLLVVHHKNANETVKRDREQQSWKTLEHRIFLRYLHFVARKWERDELMGYAAELPTSHVKETKSSERSF